MFAMTFATGSIVYESQPQTNLVSQEGDAEHYMAAAEFAKERLDAVRGASATSPKRCIWPAALNVVALGQSRFPPCGKGRRDGIVDRHASLPSSKCNPRSDLWAARSIGKHREQDGQQETRSRTYTNGTAVHLSNTRNPTIYFLCCFFRIARNTTFNIPAFFILPFRSIHSMHRLRILAGVSTWLSAALWFFPAFRESTHSGFGAQNYNFGILTDAKSPCFVTFHNRGLTDLTLMHLDVSCSCVKLRYQKRAIKSGDHVSILSDFSHANGRVDVLLTAMWQQDGRVLQSTCHLSAEVSRQSRPEVYPVPDPAFEKVR